LEEIYNADTGAPCSSKHIRKKQFIDIVKKSLIPHGSKAVTEAAAITCVKLCKAATYINILDSNNVVFSLVKTVIADLKQLLFKVRFSFQLICFSRNRKLCSFVLKSRGLNLKS
jgi:neurofibromin 1